MSDRELFSDWIIHILSETDDTIRAEQIEELCEHLGVEAQYLPRPMKQTYELKEWEALVACANEIKKMPYKA